MLVVMTENLLWGGAKTVYQRGVGLIEGHMLRLTRGRNQSLRTRDVATIHAAVTYVYIAQDGELQPVIERQETREGRYLVPVSCRELFSKTFSSRIEEHIRRL